MSAINQKEYLKKYLSLGNEPGKKKKRKKKPSVVSNRVKIIDDDVDITFNEAVEEDLHGLIEDAPQIVGVIDERPLELRIGDYRNSDLWKPVGAEDSIENITNNIYSGSAAQTSTKNPPERINKIMQSSSSKYSDDYSPPRKRRDSDNNLKSRKSDASPMQRSSRRDEITYNRRSRESSDEYQERHGNASPSRDNRKYNTSPPRKNKRDRRDSDKSPIRRSKVDISSARGSRRDRDVSPERRNSDASPRRRNKVDDDMSPPRRNIKDYEQSPVKRYRRSSDGSSKRKAYDDMSPPRRNVKTYEKSPARRNVKEYDKSPSRRSRRDSDVSPKRKNNDGSPVGRNKAYDMSPPRRNTREYNKSPSRRSRRDSDVSPKRKNTDRCPVRRNKADNDTSPSRKVIRDYNKGLNRRSRRSSDVSPKRKFSDRSPVRRNRFDDDRSPSRGQIKDYDSSRRARNDLSPLRRLSRNSDIGANRSQRMDRSQSPSHTRRYNYEEMRKSSSLNSDDYENRNSNRAERKYNTESDGTPPRKYNSGKDTSPNISKTEKLEDSSSIKLKTSSGAPRKSRWDDDTPSQPRIQIERKSGLQRANELIEQNEFFKDLAGPSMAIVAPIVRDRKTGKIRDFKKEEEEATKKQEKEDEIKAKYDRWGKGLKQVEDATEKLSSELHEMNKPLARYADDEDLERHLKEMERDGDPMLQYLRKKKRRQDIDEGKTFKPQFEGEFMPNRYGVSPGHRWDGVDRSNGYEKKWFEVMNSRRAQQEDAYKWSTEDM